MSDGGWGVYRWIRAVLTLVRGLATKVKAFKGRAEGEKGVGRVVWQAGVRHCLALKDADSQGQGRGEQDCQGPYGIF